MDPDISIWRKTGHFYFALTRRQMRVELTSNAFAEIWFHLRNGRGD